MSKEFTINPKNPLKTYKFSHVGPTTWRQIFLHVTSDILEDHDKFVHERSSTITPILSESRMKIHMGRGYIFRKLSKYSVGYKFGEFTWNRQLALYKAKQMRRKKKKQAKQAQQQAKNAKR